ncbi:MAG: response regulator transcription factor [Acidobacteria bacterium]|nr:response regulator transcription factor [Acidobacteriota bacterium]
MIKVLLVEDQTLVRRGICGLLALTSDIEVIAEAVDGEEALAKIPQVQPDVVLLDVRLPKMSGIEVLTSLRNRGGVPPTILLTTFDDDEALLKGVRAGARGFLLKDVSVERLADAIRQVNAGASLIRPAVTERVEERVRQIVPGFESLDQPDRLTRRETEVLRLMAGGYSNREIADSLELSEGVIKNHVSNVLSKLGVRDRTRAVLKGIELGYI